MYWSTNLALADEPDDGPGRPCTSFSAFVSCTQHSSASASNVSQESQLGDGVQTLLCVAAAHDRLQARCTTLLSELRKRVAKRCDEGGRGNAIGCLGHIAIQVTQRHRKPWRSGAAMSNNE